MQVEYNFNICEGGEGGGRAQVEGASGVRQMKLVEAGGESANSCYTSFMRWHLYWSKKHRIAWCKVPFPKKALIKLLQVPKAGSSSWVTNFLKLAGVEATESKGLNGMNHKTMRKHYPTPKLEVPNQLPHSIQGYSRNCQLEPSLHCREVSPVQ